MRIDEEAKNYVPPKTLNVADLEKFDIKTEAFDGEGTDKQGNTFKYKFIRVNDQEYRIPGVVLGGIKAILERMPNTKWVTVIKSGEGLATRYNVMPFTQPITQEEIVAAEIGEAAAQFGK